MKFTQEELDEMGSARDDWSRTRRPTIQSLEAILYEPIPVLDHGSVTLVDYQGDEQFAAAAARVSYGRGTKKTSNNRGLLRHLMKNQHWTPYEMCSMVFRIEMPIMVMRQLVRHRTAKINEYSGRYSVMPTEFYVPHPSRLSVQSKKNKQGSGTSLSDEDAGKVLELLRKDAESTFENYNRLLDDFDLARELARLNLPLSAYTKIYWKMDIRNLFHFLGLRMDSHAQWEIRKFANVIGSMVEMGYPNMWQAFIDYGFESVTLSRMEAETLRKIIQTGMADEEDTGMSKREWREFRKQWNFG